MTFFVIAGSVRQYHDYLRKAGVHADAARYVVDVKVLLYHFDPEEDLLVWVGNYFDRPDYAVLEAVARNLGGSSVSAA